jgi:hypothetical protein
MRISACFSADYVAARVKFCDAATDAGAAMGSYSNPASPPNGAELTTHTAWLGPARPKRLLILMSGTHGVEGFCGSGIQAALLKSGLVDERQPDTALLFIHAINPSGFASIRRVTEGNVDLNRNFVEHNRRHPVNRGYCELRDALCPDKWDRKTRAAAASVLAAFEKKHGFREFQKAISLGQYADPDGLFYGGRKPTWSNRTFRDIIARYVVGARHVAFIDLHSGLGPYGVGEINNNHSPGVPGFQRVKDWFGPEATSAEEGNSATTEVIGTVTLALEQAVPPSAVTSITLEYGTVPALVLLEALRADNWLHRCGKPESKQGRAITAELRKVFYPDTDEWRAMVWERAVDVFRRTMKGLSMA